MPTHRKPVNGADIVSAESIAAALSEEIGGAWSLGDALVRSHSTLYLGRRANAASTELVIKVAHGFRHRPGAAEELETEREALKHAATVFPPTDREFGVPSVVSSSSDGWLALQYIKGECVPIVLRRLDGRGRHELMGRLGRWLNKLHRACDFQEHDTLDMQKYVGRVVENPDRQLPDIARSAIVYLRSLSQQCPTLPFPTSFAHGDAKIDNFIVGLDQKLYGIDLQLRERGSVAFDLAGFLNRFEVWTMSRAGVPCFVGRASLERAFLEGYGWSAQSELVANLSQLRLAAACGVIDDLVTVRRTDGLSMRRRVEYFKYLAVMRGLYGRMMAGKART